MEATRTILLDDGRTLAYDDVGDPRAPAIVYLHGTPDCRLARHPDDALTARLGARLLAVDRPGFGRSTEHPGGNLPSIGDDLAALLDHLGLDRVTLLGWSSGGLAALAAATALGDRVGGIGLVGTVPPIEAYADPRVLAALGPARRTFVELALEVPPAELAAEVAPYLVPDPLDAASALDHVVESAGDVGRAEMESVPGATRVMVAALRESVVHGMTGLEQDVARQLEPGLDLAAVVGPVLSWHGGNDPVSPPAVGTWIAEAVPRACVRALPDAGHHLLFPRWGEVVVSLLDGGDD